MAISCLREEWPDGAAEWRKRLFPDVADSDFAVLVRMIERGVNSPWTSSAGRLFDAVSAMLGLCRTDVSYDGQAAILLQTVATDGSDCYTHGIERQDGQWVLSFGEMLRQIAAEVVAGESPARISGRFHRTVARGVTNAAQRIAEAEGLDTVALTGGVFQNDLFLRLVARALSGAGLHVVTHRETPPNDGCISLGQAGVALAQRSRGGEIASGASSALNPDP
jgi:hydrogenase maturation protein HypF